MKKIVCLTMAVLMMGVLAACGPNGGKSAEPDVAHLSGLGEYGQENNID